MEVTAQIQTRYSQKGAHRFPVPAHLLHCFCCLWQQGLRLSLCLGLPRCTAVFPIEGEMQSYFLWIFWVTTTLKKKKTFWSWICCWFVLLRAFFFQHAIFWCISFLGTKGKVWALHLTQLPKLCSFVQHIVQWPLQFLKEKIVMKSLFSFPGSGLLFSL